MNLENITLPQRPKNTWVKLRVIDGEHHYYDTKTGKELRILSPEEIAAIARSME